MYNARKWFLSEVNEMHDKLPSHYTNAEKNMACFVFLVLKAPRGTQIWHKDKSWVSFEKFRKLSIW